MAAGVPGLKLCQAALFGDIPDEEALEALHDAAQAYIEVLKENGKGIPLTENVETLDTPAVAVNV